VRDARATAPAAPLTIASRRPIFRNIRFPPASFS